MQVNQFVKIILHLNIRYLFNNGVPFTAADPCIPYSSGLSVNIVSASSEVLDPSSVFYTAKSVRQSADTIQSISINRLNFDQELVKQGKNTSYSSSG